MSDRFPTQVKIGGKIKKALLPQLIAQINSQQLQREFGSDLPIIESETDLLKYKNQDGLLYFCREEQSWGRFADLEKFLVEKGIAFDRHHSPRYEYLGELAQFRTGMKAPHVGIAKDDGALLIDAFSLQEIRDTLKKDKSDKGIQTVLREMDWLCLDADVKPLEPFEIIASERSKKR